MTTAQAIGAGVFATFVVFCWLFYFKRDIRRWLVERGPRQQLAREVAAEREAEMDRLRDELASKYLPPDIGRPPPTDG